MTAPLYAIGRFCSRHHWPTIARLDRRSRSASSSPARRATARPTTTSPCPAPARPRPPNCSKTTCPNRPSAATRWSSRPRRGAALTAPKYAGAIDESVKRLNAMHDVNSAVNPLSPAGAAFLSKDRSVAYVPVVLGIGPGELDRSAGAGGPRRRQTGRRQPGSRSPSAPTSASSSPSPTPAPATRSASPPRS